MKFTAAINDLEFSMETCRQALAALEKRGMPGDPEELRRGIAEREAALALLKRFEKSPRVILSENPA